MRIVIVIWTYLFCFGFYPAKSQAPTGKDLGDTSESKPLLRKLNEYFFKSADSTALYAGKIYQLGVQRKNYALQNHALHMLGEAYRGTGNFPKSFETLLQALRLNESNNDQLGLAHTHSFIGSNYLQLGQYRTALEHFLPHKQAVVHSNNWIHSCFISSNIAFCYTMLGKVDSAMWFNEEAKRLLGLSPDTKEENDFRKKALRTLVNIRFGETFKRQEKWDEAAAYYHYALMYALKDSIGINVGTSQKNLADVFMGKKMYDSAAYYAVSALQNSQKTGPRIVDIESAQILAEIFGIRGSFDSAHHYLSIATGLKDIFYGPDKFNQLRLLALEDQNIKHGLEAKQTQLRNRLVLVLVGVVAVSFLVLAFIQRRSNHTKQIINKQLSEQKSNLEKTLEELKSTQAQLVQSEKMASLGELTAGIAHEIQNPLNFVNNFSEVNQDLLKDLKAEMKRGNHEEVNQIADNLISNEEKINHHGKRADAIVKSMLQHSHSTSGQKEPTDFNALAEEYLRLAYHGLRAKDKTFNASLQTNLDPSIGKINIVSQEIGRVLLNLFNNAFYALSAKMNALSGNESYLSTAGAFHEKVRVSSNKYQPVVEVTTRRENSSVVLIVRDNGNGIPEKIIDKVFQPFFTTKPTGQGTGLGLSLTYDIIKAHDGEIKVTSTEGQGSEFFIVLNTDS